MRIEVAIADVLDRAALEDVILKDRKVNAIISAIGRRITNGQTKKMATYRLFTSWLITKFFLLSIAT